MHTLTPPKSVQYNRAGKKVTFKWQDGSCNEVSDRTLRCFCACSECRTKSVIGKELIGRDSTIETIEAFGTSGLQIHYCDGHNQGIYPWDYLHAICTGSAMEHLNG